jgi:hypothetical protein
VKGHTVTEDQIDDGGPPNSRLVTLKEVIDPICLFLGLQKGERAPDFVKWFIKDLVRCYMAKNRDAHRAYIIARNRAMDAQESLENSREEKKE